LAALISWSVSPFFFTGVGKRVGAFATNLLRLAIAWLILLLLVGAKAWLGAPAGMPGLSAWSWLIASGVTGLAIGDAFLYRAFVSIGPERTSQIQTLAPAATAALAWVGLKEFLSAAQLGGMALILAGVFLATSGAVRAGRNPAGAAGPADAELAKPAGYLKAGLWAAIWSALFQGIGTVMARKAFLGQAGLDPLLATTIRIGAGSLAVLGYARSQGPLSPMLAILRNGAILRPLLTGTLFGPLIGMVCYISALKLAPAGIVTTITFMAPLIIIPIGARLYRTRIAPATLWGTALSLAGVGLLGLGR
jgi:drug/metabolite transporter (DMT)-like permease